MKFKYTGLKINSEDNPNRLKETQYKRCVGMNNRLR